MPNWHFSLCAFPVGLLPAGIAAELGIVAAGSERLSTTGAYNVRSCLLTELSSVKPCACFALAVLPVVLLGIKHAPAAGTDNPADRIGILRPTTALPVVHFRQIQLIGWLQFIIVHSSFLLSPGIKTAAGFPTAAVRCVLLRRFSFPHFIEYLKSGKSNGIA